MPTNIKLTCSINAGAYQQGPVDGGIQVDGDDVVQLSHANTSGASKYRFEIVDYPPGVSLTDFPGWSLDSDGRTIYYAGPNPPAFTIPDDSGVWGNWLLRLIIDDGRRPSTTRPGELEVAADLIDATIGLVKPGQVLKDTAFTETLQIDQQRYAVAAMKYNWRALDALAVSAGGEANIASNVGTGVGVYDSKDGVEFLFRSILAGTGISVQLVDGGDGLHDIRISATGVGGGGGGGGIPYTFDTGTGASNPGDGELRFNDATYLSATAIHINDEDANGADMTGFIPTWDDSTSTIKGILIITSGSTAIMVAAVTAVAANSGYYTVSITPLAADGTFPTDPGALRVLFCPKGDKGDGGATGAAGANGTDGDRGEPGGESYRFTHNSGSVDPDADPGAGQVVFDDADETAATEIAVDVEDALGRDISDWLDSLDDAAGAFKGRLRAYSWEDPSLFIEYTLTSVTSASGYRKLGVTYLYGPGGFGNDAGDLVLSFARPGDGTDGLPGGESFFWNHKQDTSDSDPLNGNLKLNATLAKDATSMMIDPINQDGSIMTDWLDSWLGGHTVTITYVTNPLAFVIFEVDTIVNVGGYHKVSFRRTIRGGNFQFGEDAQLLVSLSRGGAGGSGGGSGTGAGSANGMMAVLDAWRRVHHPSPSTPHASDRLGLWVPGFNHWIKLEFDSLDGPESTGIGDGGIHVAVMAGAEGGLTGAIHSRDFPGGWMSHGSVAAAELHSPLCATAVQVVSSGGQTTYVFVGASRMEGFGSASGKLFRSTDGGKTFTSYDLQRSDTVGPSLILWTGTRLVVSYNASGGQVETSEATSIGNLGTSWTGRTVPNSKARRWGATNGSGTVVLVGEDEDFLYSTDHGATWTAGSFGDFDDAKPVGCVFCNGRFYVLLDSQAMLTSEDGISWLGPTLPSFSYATETSNLKPIRDKCFRAHGDLLVCFWKDESSPPDDYKTDVYYCNTTEFPEGTHWTRSGAFGKRYLVDATYRPRIQLVTSSADSPAHNNQRRTQIDRLQMLFFADQGDFSAGGGQYAECWVSPMDVVRRGGAGTTTPGGSGGGSTGSGNALIRQLFNQLTTMAAPGDAKFRLNNALPSLATAAAFDDLTVDNIDVSGFLQTEGELLVTIHSGDFADWHQYRVTGLYDNTGWTQWDIEYVRGNGTFVDGAEYAIEIDKVSRRFPFEFSWKTGVVSSDYYHLTWDVGAEWPSIQDGRYCGKILMVADGSGGYSQIAEFLFHFDVASGSVVAVQGFSTRLSDMYTSPNEDAKYQHVPVISSGPTTDSIDDFDIVVASGALRFEVDIGGIDVEVYAKLIALDRMPGTPFAPITP